MDIGILVEGLQRERDAVTLFMSELGSDTRGSLREPFLKTDEAITRLHTWPQLIDDVNNNMTSFKYKLFCKELDKSHLVSASYRGKINSDINTNETDITSDVFIYTRRNK